MRMSLPWALCVAMLIDLLPIFGPLEPLLVFCGAPPRLPLLRQR
jgi:hypothetical protein